MDNKDSVLASFLKVDMDWIESNISEVVSSKLKVVRGEVVQTTAGLWFIPSVAASSSLSTNILSVCTGFACVLQGSIPSGQSGSWQGRTCFILCSWHKSLGFPSTTCKSETSLSSSTLLDFVDSFKQANAEIADAIQKKSFAQKNRLSYQRFFWIFYFICLLTCSVARNM